MKKFIALSALLALTAGCQDSSTASSGSKPAPIDPNESAVSGNPAMAPVDYGATLAKGKKSSEAKIAISTFEKAIQTFKTMEGRLPSSLEELQKEGHLTKMPKTPYGMKFTYDPKTGKVDVVMAK